MSEECRKIDNLRVVDLRNELAKRNLDKNGIKTELIERLSKALIDEGHDLNAYLFDTDLEKKSQVRKRRSALESDGEAKNNVDVDEEETTSDSLDNESRNEDGPTDAVIADNSVASENEDTSTKAEEEEAAHELEKEDTEVSGTVTENHTEKEDAASNEKAPKEQRIKTVAAASVEMKADQSDVNEEKTASLDSHSETVPTTQKANSESNVKETVKEDELIINKEDDDSINLTIGEDEVQQLSVEHDEKTDSEKKKDEEAPPSSTILSIKESPKSEEKVKSEETKTEGTENRDEGKKTVVVVGNSRSLWISGLSSKTRATDLKQLFSKYGKVVGAKIVTNAKTPGARCYGYVTMLSCDDAAICMKNLHLTELHGRVISVEKAKDDTTAPTKSMDSKKDSVEPRKSQETKTDEKKTTEDKSKSKPSADKKIEKEKPKESEEEKSSASGKESKEKSDSKVSDDKKTPSVKSAAVVANKSVDEKRRSRSKSEKSGDEKKKDVVPLDLIKQERERIRRKEREWFMRQEERRRRIERERRREIEERQREEAMQLAKERMQLKMEREKIEREKLELLRIERENQRLERERLQREKEELRRTQMKLEETRRAVKRSLELKDYEEERKRRASAERRRIHVTASVKKDSSARDGSSHGGGSSSMEYLSRRVYDASTHSRESSRKDRTSREKAKDSSSSRYGSSRGSENGRSKTEISHKSYTDVSRKSDSSRYERSGESEWRSAAMPVPSYSGSGSNSSLQWSSSSASKPDSMAPWVRQSMGSGPPADRWAGGPSNNITIGRSGGASINSSTNPPYRPAAYANPGQSIDIAVSPYDRYDAYKQPAIGRKY